MKSFKVYLLVIVLSCLPFLSIFLTPQLPHTSDGGVQLPRMGAYYKALADGHIPVRWVGDLNYGYGLPLFNFIYHTPFLVSSALVALHVGLIPAFKIVLALSFILSGVFMLGFAREFFRDDRVAILVTVFYQFTPYRLIEMLVRGSIGSIYAYTFLPLTLWAVVLVWKKPSLSRMAFLSLAAGLMIISHNALALLFFGCIGLFTVLFRYKKNIKEFFRAVSPSIVGLTGGLLVSAFYWIPALLEHKYTYGDLFMKDLYRTSFPPLLNFLIPNPLDNARLRMSEISVNFGIFQTIALVITVYILLTRWKKLKNTTRLFFVYGLVLLIGCLFFMQPISIPLWERISFLRQFQFSWRFLSVVVLATTFLSLAFLEVKLFRNKLFFWGLITLTILSTAFYWNPTQGYDSVATDKQFWDYPLNTTYFGETDVVWSAGPAKGFPPSRIEVIDGSATISAFNKITQRQTFTVESTTGARLVSNTQYYPGWNVYLNGNKTDVQFQDPNWRGLITFMIPEGITSVQVTFEETKLRKFADVISLSSIIIVLLIIAASTISLKKSSLQKFQFLPIMFLAGVTVFFFYKTFLHGFIPFPGDLLISEYKPWSTYSFLGYNPGSYPSKKQYFDTIRQIYPWRTLVNEQIKKRQLPLWNPYNFSGSPLLANVQSQVFYPLTALYFFFNQKIGWTILVLLQPLLSSFFMYLYMRKINASAQASVLAGISYGFSLYMTVFLEYNTIGHVLIWVPFLFLMVELMREHMKPLPAAGFVFGITSAAFAGHLQLFITVLIFTFLYILVRVSKNRLFFLFLLVVSIGISCIQFIPTAELLSLSARTDHNYADLINRLLIQPKQLFMAFSPDIFGNPATNNYLSGDSYPGKALGLGIIPLFFALFCLIQKKRDGLVLFFGGTIGFLLMIMVRSPITEMLYFISIPFFSASAPTNNIFILSFALAVLAGKGFDIWKEKKEIPIRFIIGFAGVFFFAWVLYGTKLMAIVPKNLLFSTAILLVCVSLIKLFQLSKPTRGILPYLLILVTIIELWYFFQKFNPFVPASLVYPETAIGTWLKQNTGVDRSWGYGTATIEANFATQISIFSPDGYDPLYPNYYGSFLHQSYNGKLLDQFTDTTRSDAIVAPGFGETDFAANPYRKQILNILGIKYILNRSENQTTEKTFPPGEFTERYKENNWTVLQNTASLPRAFLMPSVKITPNIEMHVATGAADIQDYSSNAIRINVQSPANAFLFLSDTYYPGWKAFVDGMEAPVIQANYALRAVPVPAGNHVVWFFYKPDSIKYGTLVSGLSILTLLATLGWMTMKKESNNRQ